jgi:hypothetical protein
MLPLVRRIVDDLVSSRDRLRRLLPEMDCLDRRRRELAWPQRSRRYTLREQIADEEQNATQASTELDSLGLVLIDSELGQVGFPTMVNNRKAFFSWRPGEETVYFWHFADDADRRSIPVSWTKSTEFRSRSRG